jgi:hypothetical protein
MFVALSVVMGLMVAGISVESLTFWLVAGLILGISSLLAYTLVFRYSPAIVLIAAGMLQIFQAVEQGISGSHPSAAWGAALASAAGTIVIGLWYRRVSREIAGGESMP